MSRSSRNSGRLTAEAAQVGLRIQLELYAIEMPLANLPLLAPELYLA